MWNVFLKSLNIMKNCLGTRTKPTEKINNYRILFTTAYISRLQTKYLPAVEKDETLHQLGSPPGQSCQHVGTETHSKTWGKLGNGEYCSGSFKVTVGKSLNKFANSFSSQFRRTQIVLMAHLPTLFQVCSLEA